MKLRRQFAGGLLGLGLSALMVLPAIGTQRSRQNTAARQEQRQARGEARQAERPPQNERQNPNRPPREAQRPQAPRWNANRPPDAQRFANPRENPNRPPSSYDRPRSFRQLSPEEKRKVLENERRLRNLPADRQEEFRNRARVWDRMTPEQRQYVRNDVLPKWKQMPADRRQAVRQRLQILQNMPEDARNRRLADPNFTRGMSEEDRQLLHNLSHLHVGEPPDKPENQPPH